VGIRIPDFRFQERRRRLGQKAKAWLRKKRLSWLAQKLVPTKLVQTELVLTKLAQTELVQMKLAQWQMV